MTVGLRIWNTSGALVLEYTDRITRYAGQYGYAINGNNMSTVLYVPGFDPSTWLAYSNKRHGISPFYGGVTITRIANSGADEPGVITVFQA
jgi:hypothetical protein